jgi:hypothetical protein
MPPSIVKLLARRMAEFVAQPQTRERLAAFGFTAVGSTPEEFAAQIKSDIDRAAAIVREAGIRVDWTLIESLTAGAGALADEVIEWVRQPQAGAIQPVQVRPK